MTKRFPTQPSNPVERYFSWNGAEQDGFVSYWDGEQEVKMEFPFVFLPLDKLSCVTGFESYQEENIYSNEVRNTQKEVLNVKAGKHTIAQGLYQDIKAEVNNKGGKFTSSVYMAFRDDSGTLRIGNIKFRGASLGPWIDLQNSKADLSTSAVAITGSETDKQGGITYRYPVMETRPVKDETNQEADKLYDILQEYIQHKVERNETQQAKPAEEPREEPPPAEDIYGGRDEMEEQIEEDDLPF